MGTFIKKIWVLPTWLVVIILQPILPKGHLLADRKITLYDWMVNATGLTYLLSFLFWYTNVLIIFGLILMNK